MKLKMHKEYKEHYKKMGCEADHLCECVKLELLEKLIREIQEDIN